MSVIILINAILDCVDKNECFKLTVLKYCNAAKFKYICNNT